MKKVVVVGGSGFLGRNVADELSDLGFSVVIFDNKPSQFLRSDQKMVVGDLLDQEAISQVLCGADYVYHFAGIADIGEASKRPNETINYNIVGTANLMQAAVDAKIQRIIYASTMYVYSSQGSFYRASKQASELIIEAYHEKFGIDYTFMRYGSLYGPNSQSWNGLKRYVREIITNGRLCYEGTGKERREYIHVIDAAKLSVKILDEQHKNKAITVTGQQIINSEDLLHMIFEIVGIKSNIQFKPTDVNSDHYLMTPYRYIPKDAKKLVPTEFIDLGQGILEVVEEVKQEISTK